MSLVTVTVTPKSGGPRSLTLDDAKERDAALIATLNRQVGRGELVAVNVTPVTQETPVPAKPRRASKVTEPDAE